MWRVYCLLVRGRGVRHVVGDRRWEADNDMDGVYVGLRCGVGKYVSGVVVIYGVNGGLVGFILWNWEME